MNNIFFFAGAASQEIGARIAHLSSKPLGRWNLVKFSDGEIRPVLKENLKGATVVIIQSTYSPAEHMMELLLMIDAAKQAGAHKVVVVTPYLGYMRQDKIHESGEAHGAGLMCRLLSAAGADQLIVCNPHTKNLTLFFKGIIKQVSTYSLFISYLESLNLKNICFVAPDKGAFMESKEYAQYFKTTLVVCDKIRHKPNEVKRIQITGKVENVDAVIIDDMVDTANTLCVVAEQLKSQGARSIRALCTHPVLSGNAYYRLASSLLEEIVVTNTIPLKQKSEKVKVLNIAPLILEAMND